MLNNFIQSKWILVASLVIVIIAIVFFVQYKKKDEEVVNLSNFLNVYSKKYSARFVDGEKENGFIVDKVNTDSGVEKGLMYINHMDPEYGLLFEFREPAELSFWMKNTYIPLDIIFISEDLKIISISKNTQILNSSILYRSEGKAKYALEINGGLSDRLNITIGDKFILENYAR